MPDDGEILRSVQAAFARGERPEHSTDYLHCEEYTEHEGLLRARDNNRRPSELEP